MLLIAQVVRLLDATEEEWEISRSEVELGDKLGQGNYGAVFKGQLTVAAMTPKIHTHKKEMDFEGKSHLSVAVKMLRCKCIANILTIILYVATVMYVQRRILPQ